MFGRMHEADGPEHVLPGAPAAYAKRRIAFSEMGVPFAFLPYVWGVLCAYPSGPRRTS